MYCFLDSVSEEKLRKYIKRTCSQQLIREIKEFGREEIYNVLFSLHGLDLLYEERIRRLLLLELPDAQIRQLAKDIGLDSDRKEYDLALMISNSPWRMGGTLVWRFAELFSVPLEYLPTRSQRSDSVELIEPFSPPPSLFDYQEELVNAVLNLLRMDTNKAFLLQLPTGAGKTRTVMEAITKYLNLRENAERTIGVLWLAHTEELCEQAIESFRRVWQANGNYDIRIARFWADYKVLLEEMAGGIIIGGYQKVVSLFQQSPNEFRKLKNLVDIVIVDEAHKALAPRIKKVLDVLRQEGKIHLIGLTATPGRGKEQHRDNLRLARIFDKKLVYAKQLGDNPIAVLQSRGVLSRLRCITKHTNISYSFSDEEKILAEFTSDIPSRVLNKLADSKSRNQIILSIVFEHVKQKNPTLVFTCTVRHAKQLAVAVAMQGYKAASIDCRMRRNLRRRSVNAFRNNEIDVLFNFGVLSTGFDAPNIKTLIVARPTSSIVLYSQMIGRGLRGALVGGTEECNLIDIKDNFENFGDVDKVYSHFERYWSS